MDKFLLFVYCCIVYNHHHLSIHALKMMNAWASKHWNNTLFQDGDDQYTTMGAYSAFTPVTDLGWRNEVITRASFSSTTSGGNRLLVLLLPLLLTARLLVPVQECGWGSISNTLFTLQSISVPAWFRWFCFVTESSVNTTEPCQFWMYL